jgi:hypothetical protein
MKRYRCRVCGSEKAFRPDLELIATDEHTGRRYWSDGPPLTLRDTCDKIDCTPPIVNTFYDHEEIGDDTVSQQPLDQTPQQSLSPHTYSTARTLGIDNDLD